MLAVLLLALPALGADLAILRNGFSIRHERRETVGSATRLYLGGDKGYIDIATDQIERFEKDLSPASLLTGQYSNRCGRRCAGQYGKTAKPEAAGPERGNQYHQRPASHRS